MFRTRYAGEPLEIDRKKAVVAICYGAKGKEVRYFPYSRVFVDVPEDIYRLMEMSHGEWRRLVEKYEREVGEIVEKLMESVGVIEWPIRSEEELERRLRFLGIQLKKEEIEEKEKEKAQETLMKAIGEEEKKPEEKTS